MLRKTIIILSLSSIVAVPAWAGEIRIPVWPTNFMPIEVTSIPVVMDIGFWIRVQAPGPIRLQQQDIRTYTGCVDLEVDTNFNVRLTCTVTPTGVIRGTYTCSLSPQDVDVPGAPPDTMPVVCVTLRDPDLRTVPGGVRNVQVATVTVKVIPRS